MKKFIKNHCIAIFFIISSVFLITICLYLEKHFSQILPGTSLEQIKKSGKIRLITDNNATSYYIYQDRPMGFEYDMAKEFAKFLHVDLEVVTPGWSNIFSSLEQDKGDFIASSLTITEEREKIINFSQPYTDVQQKLIHHKLIFGIKKIKELAGKKIHVRKGTSYHARLEEIKQSGIDFEIMLYDNIPTEELIRMVAEREIKYTVADSNIALLNRRYYPDISIGLPLQEKESLGWAVRKENLSLLKKINEFLQTAEDQGLFGKIYEKYYGDIDIFDYFDLKKFHERIKTRLPKYKETIIKESNKFDFDWRMIAAVIYQESHYNPKAKSRTGVRGLMQVTLTTAMEMGIKNRLDPHQSIKAGIKYLNKMYKRFDKIEDNEQRLLFAMASYNVGYGHVRDAQALALDQGMEKNQWSSLKITLPLLTKRKYYKNTRYGYARGREPVKYVERILTYYDILKQKTQVL